MKLLPPEKYADANNAVMVIAPENVEQHIRNSARSPQEADSMLQEYERIKQEYETTKSSND